MSRQIVETRDGGDVPYKSVPNFNEVRSLVADLFTWSGEYGLKMDDAYHKHFQEQLAILVDKMIGLGLIDVNDLIGDRPKNLSDFVGYLKKLLLTQPDQLILANEKLIKARVEKTIFPGSFLVEARPEDVPLQGELGDADFIVDDMDVARKLLEQLQSIAHVLPSQNHLKEIARAKVVAGTARNRV